MVKNQKKIWITGASSGIGKALALKFAKENWQVAISARRKELLDELAQNDNISSFPLDVTDDDLVKITFSNILNKFKNIMNVNFFGVLNCITVVEEYFKKKKDGHISIVSSVAAYRGLPNSSGYGPSKAALTNLTESLYFDFKKYNVRISLISPGFIKTPLTDKNTFEMPFIKSPKFAADKMFKGLVKGGAFEITFPKELTTLLKILRILPYRVYLFLINKFVKR